MIFDTLRCDIGTLHWNVRNSILCANYFCCPRTWNIVEIKMIPLMCGSSASEREKKIIYNDSLFILGWFDHLRSERSNEADWRTSIFINWAKRLEWLLQCRQMKIYRGFSSKCWNSLLSQPHEKCLSPVLECGTTLGAKLIAVKLFLFKVFWSNPITKQERRTITRLLTVSCKVCW